MKTQNGAFSRNGHFCSRLRRPAQLALGWVLAQRPWIVPIPGTTQYMHLAENVGASTVHLAADDLREFDAGVARIKLVVGRADPFTESQFDRG